MSNQSGITSSQQLINSFKHYITSGARCILVEITNEQVVPVDILPGTDSLDADFNTIQQHLNDSTPRYVIVKNDDSPGKHIFTSFVPDNSPVKLKMLYASTKNTLIRELGAEFFHPILFLNELQEVSAEGWDAIKKHENLEKPLSSGEKSLETVKKLELLNSGGIETRKKALVNHSSNALSFGLPQDVVESVAKIGPDQLITLVIGPNETIVLEGEDSVSGPSDLVNKLLQQQPSYSLYSYKNNLYFIYSCPSGSKVRDRMLYASSKQGLLNDLKASGFEPAKVFEVGDAQELELSEFGEKMKEEQTVQAPRFSKPKGPRRR